MHIRVNDVKSQQAMKLSSVPGPILSEVKNAHWALVMFWGLESLMLEAADSQHPNLNLALWVNVGLIAR